MTRSNQNWFALACAAAYIVCFLLLPFYRIVVVGVTGWMMLLLGYPIMYLPLLLGIAMAVGALVLDVRVSMGIGGACTLATFLLMVLGRDVLLSGNALAALGVSALNESVGANVTQFLPVSAGLGAILCLLLCAGFIVLELVLGQQSAAKRRPVTVENPLDEDFF